MIRVSIEYNQESKYIYMAASCSLHSSTLQARVSP